MRVRMLVSMRAAPEGGVVCDYQAGQVYDITGSWKADRLVATLLREGWAVDADAPPAETETAGGGPEQDPAPTEKRKGR